MTWNRWYAFRSYLRSSLWIVPFVVIVVEQLVLRALIAVDAYIDWIPKWSFNEAGTSAVLQTIITLTLSFLVFTFGSMLVALQVASGQLTPRIIATTLLRDNVIRGAVGLFIFTMLFAIGAVSRVGSPAGYLIAWVAVFLGLMSIAVFLYLIDYAARLLRPVTIVWLVGEEGMGVIESVYPIPIKDTDSAPSTPPRLGKLDRVISHSGKSGIVLAVNVQGLMKEARSANDVVEFVPRVGDFVASDEPLFRVFGKGVIDERKLIGAVAFGPERTMEQDSTFAFRIIVDIAIKALSKAINDPTTAVLAIDQLQRLLKKVGGRHFHDDQIRDENAQLRLVLPTPNWEDFVQLAFSEIRLYGAENFQIARRLRAAIENLIQTLPQSRAPPLHQELRLLDQSIDRFYSLAEERQLARTPDKQGLGGSAGRQATDAV